MPPTVQCFPPDTWATEAARLVQAAISSVLAERGACHIALTGGRAAEQLHTAWRELLPSADLSGTTFWFGDERCVPPEDAASNFGLARRTLFRDGMTVGTAVVRMEAEASDREAAARRYEAQLPKRLDLLLLGVGEDGHIASLFPGHPAVHERDRRVLHVTGPKAPFERLTIAPSVVQAARRIIVLAPGAAKAAVLAGGLRDPSPTPPLDLILDATWLLDTPLPDVTD